MSIHAMKLLVFSLLLLAGSCSRSAGGGQPAKPSSQTPCNTNTDCKVAGEACDPFVAPPSSTSNFKGVCLKKCTVSSGAAPECNASLSETCSPITGFCEQTCSGQSSTFCTSYMISGGSATSTCVSGSYCAFVDSSPGTGLCPSSFSKGAGGFCKALCQSDANCSAVSGQVCDPITGTCEIPCQKSTDCSNPAYTISNNQTTVNQSCSPITSMCVPSCSTISGSQQNCPSGALRGTCYVPGYPTAGGSGTCEEGCTSHRACTGNIPKTCAEGVCQMRCSSDTDCKDHGSRTKCDLISLSCAVPCSSNTQCTSLGTVCSSISATCVASCNPSTSISCPSQDSLRNGCVQATLSNKSQSYYSCEQSCTGYATAIHVQPQQGDCSAASQYCIKNINFGAGFIPGYCGVACTVSNNTCDSLTPIQDCSNFSICSL